MADDKGLTQTGYSAGYTAMFAAPEQLRGKPADARSDIYSLQHLSEVIGYHQRPNEQATKSHKKRRRRCVI